LALCTAAFDSDNFAIMQPGRIWKQKTQAVKKPKLRIIRPHYTWTANQLVKILEHLLEGSRRFFLALANRLDSCALYGKELVRKVKPTKVFEVFCLSRFLLVERVAFCNLRLRLYRLRNENDPSILQWMSTHCHLANRYPRQFNTAPPARMEPPVGVWLQCATARAVLSPSRYAKLQEIRKSN
jgi:hypothetical protein